MMGFGLAASTHPTGCEVPKRLWCKRPACVRHHALTPPLNAIVAMRFDTSEMGPNWTEICAYGTAVRIRSV